MTNLTILTKQIRLHDGLHSLNDLHKAAGNARKHTPSRFIRNEQTQELINEIGQDPDLGLGVNTIHGGINRGTYVCKELVYAYAMWISPKFHLTVIRAFDQIAEKIQNHALPPNHQLPPSSACLINQEKYALANQVISQLNLPNDPVIVPYCELASFVEGVRSMKEQLLALATLGNTQINRIQRVKNFTHRKFMAEHQASE